MLTIEIEFKNGRRMETAEGEVSYFDLPYKGDSSRFLMLYGKNNELLYAIEASEILVMAVDYDNNEAEEKDIKESVGALNRVLEELEDSTDNTEHNLSEIQKFLYAHGFNLE